jgi:hypothetical protein
MLTYSNFYKNVSSLIYEETDGLLVNAYAMRSGNNCRVTSVFNKRPRVRFNQLLNLSDHQKEIIGYIEKGVLVDKSNPLNKFIRKNLCGFYSK